ncbi:MAG: HNH endonuclease [Acholeplasmataceae bacterium]|nr:HNH endonuclease [Acholeplasmataceae bacterium]
MQFEDAKITIRNNNAMWREIETINSQYNNYNFDDIKAEPIKYEKRTSKAKYGRSSCGGALVWPGSFDFKAFLSGKIYEEMIVYTELINKYIDIFIIFNEYKKKVLKVFETRRLYKDISTAPSDNRNWFAKNLSTTTENRFKELKKYEEELLNARTFSPQFPYVILHLMATVLYDNYDRDDKYEFNDILECYQMALEKEGKMTFIQQQRAIISDDKRYDIMKRDGFKCCICGAKATDGVRLEVDHIMPVSKGGKSTDANLQTLCERCNKGKRDKY